MKFTDNKSNKDGSKKTTGTEKQKQTFTKKAVRVILAFSILDLQLSYVLAFLGREQIAETLSITVVTEIIAVMLGYFLKSFKETKEQEELCYKRECRGQEQQDGQQEETSEGTTEETTGNDTDILSPDEMGESVYCPEEK